MKQALLVFFSALLCAACPTGGADPSDQDPPPDSAHPGFMTVTGFSESIPTLNAIFLSADNPMSGGYDTIWAAQDLHCGLLTEHWNAMAEPMADYEAGLCDFDCLDAAGAQAWNGYVAVPSHHVHLRFPSRPEDLGPSAWSWWIGSFEASWSEQAGEDDPRPGQGEPLFDILNEIELLNSEITDVTQGVVGTFEFLVATGRDEDGTWTIDEIQLEVDAPACEF